MNYTKYEIIKQKTNHIYNIKLCNLQNNQNNIIKKLNLQNYINLISNIINFVLNYYFNIHIINNKDKLIIKYIKKENLENKELNIKVNKSFFSNNLKIKIIDNFNNINIDKINCVYFHLLLNSNYPIDFIDLKNINENYIEPILYHFFDNKLNFLNLNDYLNFYNKTNIINIINKYQFEQEQYKKEKLFSNFI